MIAVGGSRGAAPTPQMPSYPPVLDPPSGATHHTHTHAQPNKPERTDRRRGIRRRSRMPPQVQCPAAPRAPAELKRTSCAGRDHRGRPSRADCVRRGVVKLKNAGSGRRAVVTADAHFLSARPVFRFPRTVVSSPQSHSRPGRGTGARLSSRWFGLRGLPAACGFDPDWNAEAAVSSMQPVPSPGGMVQCTREGPPVANATTAMQPKTGCIQAARIGVAGDPSPPLSAPQLELMLIIGF